MADCPIIDMKVVSLGKGLLGPVNLLSGYLLTEKSFIMGQEEGEESNRYQIAYSSTVSSSGSVEPLISTIPLNTQVPCPRPDHERLI